MNSVEKRGYDVRKLSTKDLFAVAKLVASVLGDVRKQLKEIENLEDMESMAFGIFIFEIILEKSEKELREILADLVGMDVETFDNEPFDAVLTIIETVNEQEDLKGFFTKVQSLAKTLSGKS